MNPESLDSSIQSASSALFPPFEATAPIVLCQSFRTIDERYQGDASQCSLDFLIPSKHSSESVQQAACAGYSDVVFRYEGWPLCLHDKTVIQLASVNPLSLRPGDFYLQVEPFGDQAARIVLKSLSEEGCREVEETPIPETSYSCLFTEEWSWDINEGRQGTPSSHCLLCTDQGVIKLPWDKISIPEFLNKPKTIPTCGEAAPQTKKALVSSHFNSSTLPVEAVNPPQKDRMSASSRPATTSSKLIKMDRERQSPRSGSKPLNKPVGWVSPNTWESLAYQEMEGDYVESVNIAKGNEFVDKQIQLISVLPKPVRKAPPIPTENSAPCGQTSKCAEEPCGQRQQDHDLIDLDSNCRYRDSYVAALKNPVPFERGGVDLSGALEEVGSCEEGGVRAEEAFETQKEHLCKFFNNSQEPAISNKSCESIECYRPSSRESENTMKEPAMILQPFSVSSPSDSKPIPRKLGHAFCEHPGSVSSLETSDGDSKPQQKVKVVKPSGKHKVKVRSMSALSDNPTGSPVSYKINNRSQSDVCPETVTSIMQHEYSAIGDQEALKMEKLKHSKKDSSSSTSSISGSGSNFFRIKVEKSSSFSSDSQQSSRSEESCFRKISSVLESGIICLPGSRDRNGRAVVEVHGDRKEWMSPLVSAESICELSSYLHTIPRKDVRESGMTSVINGRKTPPPLSLYKALSMAQEQALHAVHSIIMLIDKDSCSRPEKQPGSQMDIVTSIKASNKTVEAPQLTSDSGGTFTYSHKYWSQFHQKHVPFMANSRGANSLLQKAIESVDSRKQMDTAQEIQDNIQEQRILMKEVSEDARLVSSQKEGGTTLARMKKEEFRFPQSEDYRDALELATSLYNQVEEKLHMSVMKSNESSQHLEISLRHREMEAKIILEGSWFSTDGEQILESSFATDDTSEGKEAALEELNSFLIKSKEKQQHALILIKEAEEIVGTQNSSPAAEIFWTLVCTFKSNVEDFMLRAEQRQKDLVSIVHMYKFCEQTTAWAKECCKLSGQVEDGCCSPQILDALQMQKERLSGEFSTAHFQASRAQASTMGAEASGISSAWNAAWAQSQEVKQRFEEMQMKNKGIDKNQAQQSTAANASGEHKENNTEGKRNELGEVHSSPISQPSHHVELNGAAKCQRKNSSKHNFESDFRTKEEFPETQSKTSKYSSDSSQTGDFDTESKCKLKEHHSIANSSSTGSAKQKDFPLHQTLGRSHSEGSCEMSVSGFLPLNHKHCHSRKHSSDQNSQPTQKLHILHHEGLQPVNSSSELKRDSSQGRGNDSNVSNSNPEDLRTTETLLTPTEINDSNILKVQMILEELLSTEREYVKASGYVREHYFPESERADVPQDLRGQRGSIFGNLEKLHDFHRHHFLDESGSCAKEPFRVGRCFLRHRESFALYALYSKNKPQSDRLSANHGKLFFKQKQSKSGDKMDLWSYLSKPVQRISKYSLSSQDMMRECGPEQAREVDEIKAASEVVHFQLRHGNNLSAMDAIHQCDVNSKEQGQSIRQDEFLVTFRKKKCFRHIFLFQDLVLFSKTRKTDVGNETYIYKQSFKTSDIGMTQNCGDSGLCFEIWFRKRKSQDTYTSQASSREVKEAWTKDLERISWEQAIHNKEVRMQERVFLGIGNKPFMDIQPSEAAINDRAINYVSMGRENKVVSSSGSCGTHSGLPERRPKSVGSGSSSSSSSSGRGSMSPVGFVGGPKRRGVSGGSVGYASPPGAVEEDEMDHDCGNQNLLLDSSESSGESVSGFSSCSHSCRSTTGEVEDSSSVCASIITMKEVDAHSTEAFSSSQTQNTLQGPVKSPTPVAPKAKLKQPDQKKDSPDSKAKSTSDGKSTDV